VTVLPAVACELVVSSPHVPDFRERFRINGEMIEHE